MSYSAQEEDIPLSFGYNHNVSHSSNNNKSLIDMKTIRQYKAEQARILEQFNTPYYSLLEFGAENMLSFEQMGKMVMELVTGSFISDTIKTIKEKIFSGFSQLEEEEDEDDTVTINKVDIIQKQLDAIVAQMEKVKEESRRKSEELERLKQSVKERSQMPKREYSSPQYSSSRAYQRPSQKPNYDDDYIMDFSKPAGYKPPTSFETRDNEKEYEPPKRIENDDVVIRRRSLEPKEPKEPKESKVLNEVKPPVPSHPPPRRNSSRDSQGKPPVPPRPNSMNQHQKLMEEIRNSANQRKMKMNEEKQVSKEDIQSIVHGNSNESKVTQNQRQLKMSLNEEIRLKMQERLKVMQNSDSEEEGNINDLD